MTNVDIITLLILVILRHSVLRPDYVVIFSVCLREGVRGRGHEGVWRLGGYLAFSSISSYNLCRES